MLRVVVLLWFVIDTDGWMHPSSFVIQRAPQRKRDEHATMMALVSRYRKKHQQHPPHAAPCFRRSRLSPRFSSSSFDNIFDGGGGNDGPLIVWELTTAKEGIRKDYKYSLRWSRMEPSHASGKSDSSSDEKFSRTSQAAQWTYNWSRHFVEKLELCPWAKTSLETPGAIQFFVVNVKGGMDEESASLAVEDVARRFVQEILPKNADEEHAAPSSMERAAIFFLLFDSNNNADASFVDSFYSYYDWFSDLEENWDDDSLQDVIVAPFHPDWTFSSDEEDDEGNEEEEAQIQRALSFEKKSPVPLVSFVSARVVEQAGETVTAKIAIHNQEVLLDLLERGKQGNEDILKAQWSSAIFPGSKEDA